MWRGWIVGSATDKPLLREFGVVLKTGRRTGDERDDGMRWSCELTQEALDKLDEHFGRFVWGLDWYE